TLRPTQRAVRWMRVANGLKSAILRLGYRYQGTIRANVLHRLPRLELKIQGKFYRHKARQQIRELQEQFIYRPPLVHEGVFPGKRLASCSDSRVTMAEKTAEVRRMLDCLWFDVGLPSRPATLTTSSEAETTFRQGWNYDNMFSDVLARIENC